MDNLKPTAPFFRNSLARHWPWLIVLAVLLFVGFIRVRLLQMPLERDEGEYAYAGQLILQGIPPYELAYNMKLPGTYFAYALGMAVFGQTPSGIHLLLLVVNFSTVVFVFLLGREMFGVTAGLAACATYGLMSTSPVVLGLAAHATQFVVLFAVPGTLLLWRAVQSGRRGPIFFCGLLYGLAFVMKQQGIFFGIFGLLALLWREGREKTGAADSSKRISLFISGALVPFAAVCLYLALAGVFSEFWFWTFSYARAYAASVPIGNGLGFLLDYFHIYFAVFVGFWMLAVAGLVAALRHATGQGRLAFSVGFLFFSFLGTVPGFYFRSHYFVLALPAFALIVGMAIHFLQVLPARGMKAAPVIFLAGVLAWNLWLQRWMFFQLSPQKLSQAIYATNPFLESVVVGNYIREHSAKDARVAVIGSEPQIYFYARRHSATGYIYTYPLMENQPYAATMQRQMISEIESAKPEYIVVVVNNYSWLIKHYSDPEIFRWMLTYTSENYDRIGLVDHRPGTEGFELWGDAAKNYHGKLEEYLDVYQRKPAGH
jgi:4-amino-4-deoxy-L-arabinose transferase-like glycosyltransferase